MKASKPAPRRPTAALRFKGEIERAVADGAAHDDLVLHLTLGDVEQLKRDREVPVADISFAGGVMKFLGVTVLKGAALSALHRSAADGL